MPWIFIRQIIRLKEYLWADPDKTQLQWRQKRTSVSFLQTERRVLVGGRDNPPQPWRTAEERFLSPSASPSGEWGLCSFIWFSKVPINLCCYPWPWGGHKTQTLSHTHTQCGVCECVIVTDSHHNACRHAVSQFWWVCVCSEGVECLLWALLNA